MKIKLTLNDFKKINYALYDQILFDNFIFYFNQEKINYKFLAVDLFGEEKAPVLISLNDVSEEVKQILYEEFVLFNETKYRNNFDQMKFFQNLIKTELNIYELSLKLTQRMIYCGSYLIRYFDPRVLIYFLIVNNMGGIFINKEMERWNELFFMDFDSWLVNVWGENILLENSVKKSAEVEVNIDFFEIKKINEIIKLKNKDYFEIINNEIYSRTNFKK